MQSVDQQKILNTMIEFAHDGILFLDPGGCIISANPTARSIFGFESENEIGQSQRKFIDLFDFYDFNDVDLLLEQLPVSRALTGEQVINCKCKGVSKNTGKAWYWIISAIPMFDEKKSIAGVVVSIMDISDSSKEIKKCETGKEYYRSLISCMAEGVVAIDPDGTIRDMNPAAMRMYGFESLNKAVRNIHEYRETFSLYDTEGNSFPLESWPIARALRGEVFSNIEVKIQNKKTGASWFADYSGTPVNDEAGIFILEVLTVQDITARKHTEALLHQYESYLSTIIEAGADGILAVDNNGRVITANSRFTGLLNIPKTAIDKETTDRDTVFVVTSDQLIDPDAFINKARRLYNSRDVDSDVVSLKDGRFLEYNCAPIPQDGTVIGRVWSFRDITRRVESQKALAESEELFRLAFMVGGYGIYDFVFPEKYAKVNPEYLTMLEYKPGEVQITFDWWERSIHPEDHERARAIFVDCIYGKTQDYKMEFRMRTKSGGYKWVLCQGKNVEYDKQGKPVRMIGTHADITDRKRMEQALREERDKLTNIAAMVPGVIYSYRPRPDGSACMPYASPALVSVLGINPKEVVNDVSPFFKWIHPDDTRSVVESITESIHTKSKWHKEFRYNHPYKGEVWIEGYSVPQREVDGGYVWQGFLTDITERKRAEEALREEQNKLMQIAATVPGVIYSYHQRPDGSAHMSYASHALLSVVGLQPEDVANDISPLFALVHPDDIRPLLESITESARTNSTWHKEFRYKHPERGEVWIEAYSVPQPEADGGITWHGFGRDITERKQSEEALRLSEEKFSKAFMTSPDSISITRVSDGALIEINNGAIKIFGYSREEMIGHSTLDLNIWVNKEDRDRMLGILYASGEVDGFETLFRRKDGTLINGVLSARIIRMYTGDYILATTRDITEQKGAEYARSRLTRELRALNSCTQVLMRAEHEQELLDDICRIICDVAGYRMAWVGFEANDGSPYIKVVARAGVGEHFMIGETYPLNDKGVTANDIVMRSKKSCIVQDIENAPKMAESRGGVDKKNGYRSAITLPLLNDAGNPFGVLSIYSGEPNVFAAEEVKLLEELGGDLAFGIRNLRLRVERRLAQSALVHEKELSDALIEAAPGIFCVLDRNGGMLRMNKVMMKLMERLPNPVKNVYNGDLELVMRGLKELPDLGHIEEDIRFEFKPGEISWWRVSGHAVTIQGTVYLIAAAFDITQRKQVEENLKKALKEKEVLIHELYHRTKNNMQVISSFMTMQAIATNDETLHTILKEMENRIAAMALVHEKLYKSKDLTNVDLREYLSDLANLLFRGYRNVAERVKLVIEAEDVFVTIDIAIPLGMVVTELFTNSLKYAFPDARSGRILLRMKKHGKNELEVNISDNGIGVPDAFDLEQITTIGIPTVLSIVRKQLRGSIELDKTGGFNWKISFRCDLYGKRV